MLSFSDNKIIQKEQGGKKFKFRFTNFHVYGHEFIVTSLINFKILPREKNLPYYECNGVPINMIHDLLTCIPN